MKIQKTIKDPVFLKQIYAFLWMFFSMKDYIKSVKQLEDKGKE